MVHLFLLKRASQLSSQSLPTDIRDMLLFAGHIWAVLFVEDIDGRLGRIPV